MAVEIKNVKFKLALPKESGVSAAGKEWEKCTAVFTTAGMYPKDIPVEAWNAQVPLIQSLKAGDDVNIHVDIEGREYNGKWYASVKLWKFDNIQAQAVAQENRAANAEAAKTTLPPVVEEEDSQLPF